MNHTCKLIEFDAPEGYSIELIPINGKLQSNEVTFDRLKLVIKIGTKTC